ncbi:Signal transduction histidine kinase [Sinosporangium album]|uniref:histidine kinase n=1 Tax=Sinosporangium album TaxID=504805 RepID=A0A1G8H2E3_9ACTN|nr:sensor domain-containing protein [Sinosporangium album]SDI00721.1 Signal transduction histidine kinase [Sinosporangium album]
MKSLLRRTLIDSRYLIVRFPMAIVGFALFLVGVAAGFPMALFYIGIPVLGVTLLAARACADAERRWLPEVLGRPVPRPAYAPPPAGAKWFRRMANPLTRGQFWMDLLWTLVNFPVSLLTFLLTLIWWAISAAALFYPLFGWYLASLPEGKGILELLGISDSVAAEVGFNTLLGLIFMASTPFVIRGLALMQAGLGRAMLSGNADLRQRIDDLAEGRRAAVSAEANALRKLERDIHDGPQQRLVHLAMELSRVQRQLKKDPAAAESTLGAAITATRETLDELRALSRGIAPPILSDRGLPAALAALAGRCTVPVELDIQTVERFPAAIENAVYFVAAESLTNIAKHSRAEMAAVSLSRTGDGLLLTIGDDGVGGAHVAKGHGLSGLADRLRAVDGEFAVQSPVGGPTMVIAEVPCG